MISKKRSIVHIVSFILVGVLILYLTFTAFPQRAIGIQLDKDEQDHFIVKSLYPFGVGKTYFHVKPGDRLLSVNGKEPTMYRWVNLDRSIEGAEEATFLRQTMDGTAEEYSIRVSDAPQTISWFGDIGVPGAALVLFIILTGLVYSKKRNDPAARLLIAYFLAIGITNYSGASSSTGDMIGKLVIRGGLAIISVLFLHFLQVYFKRYGIHFLHKRTLPIFYGVWGIIVASSVILNIPTLQSYTYYMVVIDGVLIYFLLSSLFVIYKLFVTLHRYRNTSVKSIIKLILTGQIVAFAPVILFTFIPYIINVYIISQSYTTAFLLILPFIYFYIIMAERFLDIELALTKFKYYSLITFVPAIFFMLVFMAIFQSQEKPGIHWIQMFLVLYVGFVAFLYIKEKMDLRIRPRLFKQFYDYQASLDRFSRNISKVMKRPDLERLLYQEIRRTLPVKLTAVIVLTKRQGGGWEEAEASEFAIPDEVRRALIERDGEYTLGETVSIARGLCYVVGQNSENRYLLWIDHKDNYMKFNTEELNWLRILINYSSIVYENLFLIERLINDLESDMHKQQSSSPWILRLLFGLSENERRKLAADLHDSALQEQLIWYRKLEGILSDYEMDESLRKELFDIKEGLLDVIHQIRETCNELRPPLLKELSIVESLNHLFEYAQMRNNYAIEFNVQPLVTPLSDEQMLALYRIVQELLRNAEKHANASRIKIDLREDNGIVFRYKDNGKGMDISAMEESFEHMGLSGIWERVMSLEGEVKFNSSIGNGFEVNIRIPLEYVGMTRAKGGGNNDSYLVGG